MIYLTNNNDNTIATDSWLEYIPEDLMIYLDDILIGTYTNISTFNEYIQLTIPSTDLVNLQVKEYKMKMYHNLALLKVELVQVLSDNQLTVNTHNDTKTIKMYERE